jgi:hypothetical protein
VESPLLSEEGSAAERPLHGSLYLAAQGENPFGSLLALYLVVEDPASGTILKLAGRVNADPSTGQLETVFDDNPQIPFSTLRVELYSGPRAALRTPSACGSYETEVTLTPWSGNPPLRLAEPFGVSGGPGGACPSGAFAPKLSAGTQNPLAGSFSPFSFGIGREDGTQELAGLTAVLPEGLTGKIAGIPYCPDATLAAISGTEGTGAAEEAHPSCPAASLVGTVTVAAGAGPDPVYVSSGRAYLAGPYKGAPFSLAVVAPAVAGPFDLGSVVVRNALQVNPETAQITAVSDTIPSILHGIPLDLRDIRVNLDRPGFTLNPTSCEPLTIASRMVSTQGASVSPSVRFQASDCGALAFKPSFKVSTSGRTSRTQGASLHVLLAYPNAAVGTQANIKSVYVELPKALPSRTSTLNHACPDSVFKQDPAGCPSQSRVGYAKAVTPVLPVPLEGPAYFVSHGGAKFPELITVLQGDGVTVDLAGETFIDEKTGITSSTFKQVPDVPVSTFELNLPQGPFSALGANTDLCAANLAMPTTFHAQNGAMLYQRTPIEVQGCPYALLVRSHTIRNHTLTLNVTVPGSGTLTAHAKGLGARSKASSSRTTLTLKLPETHAGALHTRVLLSFTPSKGRQRKILRKTLTVTFG